MAHLNEITVKTAKVKGTTQEDIKTSLASEYPDFVVADIFEDDKNWRAILTKELDAKTVAKMAAEEFGEEKEESEPTEEKSESSESESEGESEGGEEKSEIKEVGEKENSEQTELKDIEQLLLELKTEVRALKEKADVVDKIHETTKPHVEGPEELGLEGPEGPGGPEELGPTAPGGGNPLGMGGPPKPPGGPPKPPGGRPRPGGGPGNIPRPMGNVKIAYAAASSEGISFAMNDVVAAMELKYPGYEVVNIQKENVKNRYVARLEIK